jgi:hypothetical protein
MSQSEDRQTSKAKPEPDAQAETEEELTGPQLEAEAGTFRFLGLHATTLESGQPIAPGEYVTFEDEKDAKKNKGLFEEGAFLPAEGMEPTPEQMTEQEETEQKLKEKEGGS